MTMVEFIRKIPALEGVLRFSICNVIVNAKHPELHDEVGEMCERHKHTDIEELLREAMAAHVQDFNS